MIKEKQYISNNKFNISNKYSEIWGRYKELIGKYLNVEVIHQNRYITTKTKF